VASYQDSVRKSRRSEATAALMGLSAAMERYAAQNGSYTGATVGGSGIYPNRVPISGGTATYNLSISGLSATAYTLNAARTGAQTSDKCGTLTLTSAGAQGISGADSGVVVADCWRR
jgi:type IV pilus assembly protein PilE